MRCALLHTCEKLFATQSRRQKAAALRVVHVIGGLDVGGAERSLLRLALKLRMHDVDSCIISLGDRTDPLVAEAERAGLTVECVNARTNPMVALWRIVGAIRRHRPHVVQAWMYHSYFPTVLATRLAGMRPKLIWAVRHSLDGREREHWLNRLWIAAGRWRAIAPDLVLFNSERGRRTHSFWQHPHRVIRNGVDVGRFVPAHAARRATGKVTIGFIARYHPMKGVDVFLDAMAQVTRAVPDVNVVMYGSGMSASNRDLLRSLAVRDLSKVVTLAGPGQLRNDDYHAFDFLVSSSLYGEGTPNVVLECMACAVPVIASNVGDVGTLLGGSAWLVPPGDADALAQHCLKMIGIGPDGRRRLGSALRRRVEDAFSDDVCTRAHLQTYAALCRGEGELPWAKRTRA
jgi:glycosyltransferase involved in cell wall biosynthesis